MMNHPTDPRHLRAKPRLKLFEPTELEAGPAPTRAHLLDLSATGALVHSASPPAPGQSVKLALDGKPRQARVMWVDDRRFGVAFRVPLSDGQVTDILDERRERVADASRRTGAIAR